MSTARTVQIFEFLRDKWSNGNWDVSDAIAHFEKMHGAVSDEDRAAATRLYEENEKITHLGDFLIDEYAYGDPLVGIEHYQVMYGCQVDEKIRDEALSLYYSYCASEYHHQMNA